MSGTQLNGNNSYGQPFFQGSQDDKECIVVLKFEANKFTYDISKDQYVISNLSLLKG